MSDVDPLQEFLAAKKQESSDAEARRLAEGASLSFRMRLRFRVLSRFNLDKLEHTLEIGETELVLKARNKGVLIKDSDWLVILGSFPSAEIARDFGNRLQTALAIAAVRERVGIDVGHKNIATLMTSKAVKEGFAKRGLALIDDVHGVDVYPNDMAVTMFGMEITATTTRSIEGIQEALQLVYSPDLKIDNLHRNAVLMLNAAMLNNEPLAKLVFSLASVEMLAHEQGWSAAQINARDTLIDVLEKAADLTTNERDELVRSIKNLRKGVNEACKRLIDQVGLQALKKSWNSLYGRRSAIFHGEKPAIDADLGTIADTAVTLCSRVVLAAVALQAPAAGERLAEIFPVDGQ